MKKYTGWAILSLSLFLGSCGLLTFYPIFTPADLVKNDFLLGTWITKNESAVFEPAALYRDEKIPDNLEPLRDKFYFCTQLDAQGRVTHRYMAFLVKIGNDHYLDLFPLHSQEEKRSDPFFTSHEMKLHTIMKVEMNARNQTLKLIEFEDSYIEGLIKNKKVRIAHSYIKSPDNDSDEILITASTKELQEFLLKYGNRSEAFSEEETMIYKRK